MKHCIHIAGGGKLPCDAPATEAICEITRGPLRAMIHVPRKALKLAVEKTLPTFVETREPQLVSTGE